MDVFGSEEHTDPKQLRKLRQQQLQQKFRREMEAKKLQQDRDQAKSEGAEVAIGRGSPGGKGVFIQSHWWKQWPRLFYTAHNIVKKKKNVQKVKLKEIKMFLFLLL